MGREQSITAHKTLTQQEVNQTDSRCGTVWLKLMLQRERVEKRNRAFEALATAERQLREVAPDRGNAVCSKEAAELKL